MRVRRYDETHPESALSAGWALLARRYLNSPNVMGADLFNEVFSGTWGDGNVHTDWKAAAERLGNAIISTGSAWLVFVQASQS